MKWFLPILCILSIKAAGQQVPIDTTYKLAFNDGFNGKRLNRTNWDIMFPWNQPKNDMVQICTDGGRPVMEQRAYVVWQNDTHNIKVYDGSVKIFVRKEEFEGEFWDWEPNEYGENKLVVSKHTVNFTTGMLYSKQSYYRGYYEIKFKLPKAPGLFGGSYAPFGPNFWTFAGDCWHEIDLFEIINGQQRTYTTNTHFELMPPMTGADTTCDPLGAGSPRHRADYKYLGTISDNEWHVASFDWQADQIIFYLDGKEYHRTKEAWVKDLQPMQMVVGIASPLSICMGMTSPLVKLPYVYEVDYVKVWQAPR